jgi:Ca-activated chloride channel family protein
MAARSAISGIRAGGGTEILQGLKLGFAEVQKHAAPNSERLKHIILLTDGQTYGDEQGCLELAKEAGKRRVPITAMGIGSDWNDKLLDEVANLSGSVGGAIYIDASAKIAGAFRDRIHGLGTIYADGLVLSLHQAEGVTVQAAYRVAPEIHPLQLADSMVSLGSLEKRRPQAIMLELLVNSHTPGRHRLLQVEVQGQVPILGRQDARVQHALTLDFEANLDRHKPIPPDIVSAMGKLTIYKMQERAMVDIELGQIDAAVDRLKTMATRLLNLGESELARAALLEAGRLAHTGSLSAEGRKRIRYGTRGLTILPKEVRND